MGNIETNRQGNKYDIYNNPVREQGVITRAWVVAASFVSIPIIVYGLGELLKGK